MTVYPDGVVYLDDRIPSEIVRAGVDLVVTSPPYEDARKYTDTFAPLTGDAWVAWAVEQFEAHLQACRGLVAWVVQGRTRNYRWSGIPMLLAADLIRRGVCLRRPCIFQRSGIPGSGGPDWFRCTHEYVICATRTQGRLPWSDPRACGAPPRFPPGGDPTHRKQNGCRVRAPSFRISKSAGDKGGYSDRGQSGRSNPDGTITRKDGRTYTPPEVANPGDVIHCSPAMLGSRLAHDHPAPFPEQLVERFVRSFCPPGGTVLDPFCGSGTVAAVAILTGRRFIAIDCDPNSVELTRQRIAEAYDRKRQHE